MIRAIFLSIILASAAWPQKPADDANYQRGLAKLDARQWDQAIAAFTTAAEHDTAIADAALYWKAYAENRAGQRDDSLETLSELAEKYPSSRWLKDARALQVEVRANAGDPVNPSAESDEELKLIALNSLMHSDAKDVLPVLQKLLSGNSSEKVKDRALFVLTQNSSPEARKILDNIARNPANPDLQRRAIRYMGLLGNADARNELIAIYKSSSNTAIKRDILHSFMQSGSKDFLLDIAKTEQNPELRRDAIRQLALTGGQDQLWQLYQSSNSVEDKKAILQSMFLGGDSTRLTEIARNEKDPKLKIAAIQSLALTGRKSGSGAGDALVAIYRSDPNPEVRSAVLNALGMGQNGSALVELARSEKDPQMKQKIVQRMSMVHSKEVTDYLMEMLK